ncbi:MAG: biopolymer transporter ExbD [Bacteroidales bacterium]|jgi:biopolymer transport protein ExbD|nr:biopolymer transporter ExbD [Bacteroidales bacterium]
MNSRFRPQKRRKAPAINTASLPDMVFTLLFFFMISTHLNVKPDKLTLELPTIEQAETLSSEDSDAIIYVGKTKPEHPSDKWEYLIQMHDKKMNILEFQKYIRQHFPEKKSNAAIPVILKADRNTPMGLIAEIRKSMHQVGMQKMHYVVE